MDGIDEISVLDVRDTFASASMAGTEEGVVDDVDRPTFIKGSII